ncbi:MAG: NAD(P)-dependent oxidoreductase [Actinomycetota bacterium]|nr:NAD(P)-dependent oxidoreductase [Actinomycetota bacterium]
MVQRSAVVTGATGYVGSHLLTALVGAGWEVRASGRRPRPDSLDDSIDYVPADLADDDLGPLLEGTTHVFHLAGASSSRSDDEEMQRTNVVGTGRLVTAAASAGVERFVHMSSTSVYGEEEQLPLPVREDVEVHPSRGYGKAKWGAEEKVWAAAARGLAAVVLRPVSVYGPGAVKLVASAALDVAIERRAGVDRLAVAREPVEQRLLHIDDLIGATLHLADHDGAVGRAFNLTSGVYPTSLEVAEILADEFGMGLELPDDADCGLTYDERAAARDKMLAEGMTDDILFTPQRFRFMAKANRNNRLSIEALESTGFVPAITDTRDGIHATVAWYREQRWLL